MEFKYFTKTEQKRYLTYSFKLVYIVEIKKKRKDKKSVEKSFFLLSVKKKNFVVAGPTYV